MSFYLFITTPNSSSRGGALGFFYKQQSYFSVLNFFLAEQTNALLLQKFKDY